MKIKKISAIQIFDSRGYPTIETEIELENGVRAGGIVPSGASTGQYEALELRDGDPGQWRGKSVFKAIGHVEGEISELVCGRDVDDQRGIDEAMIALDGTENKTRLGANAILSVSMAAANAAAKAKGEALYTTLGSGKGTLLPLPEIQIIGGGAHANWRTDIQDFMIIAKAAKTYREALEITFNIYHAAGDILHEQGRRFGLADEGGYWPELTSNEEAFELIISAIERAGYTPGVDASISLDIAASDLYDRSNHSYCFPSENRSFTSAEFSDLIIDWCQRYPVISIEDPAADTDWEAWIKIKTSIGRKVQIIGDDLFTTNLGRIRKGIEKNAANAVLIKLNQIGTVSETLDAIRLTQDAGWLPVISARSGETEDTFIAHLAVATNAGQLKVGSFARSERMAKWNEVLRIERHLGERSQFKGAEIYQTIHPEKT